MKVGLIIYGTLETVSGGYLYDRKLVEYLQQQGDEVSLISLPWSRYGRHLLYNFSGRIRQQLRKLDVDILLQDELNHPSLFLMNRWFRELVVPLSALCIICAAAKSTANGFIGSIEESSGLI